MEWKFVHWCIIAEEHPALDMHFWTLITSSVSSIPTPIVNDCIVKGCPQINKGFSKGVSYSQVEAIIFLSSKFEKSVTKRSLFLS